MRYRKKEIGCEVRYSELDLRALEYIGVFLRKEDLEEAKEGEKEDGEKV